MGQLPPCVRAWSSAAASWHPCTRARYFMHSAIDACVVLVKQAIKHCHGTPLYSYQIMALTVVGGSASGGIQ